MEHVAIMKKSWKLTDKILAGQKRIESRWYKARVAPWGRIKEGETVYFKDSGEPVTLKAEVEKVMQFSGLNPGKVKEILDEYSREDGICIDDVPKFYELFKDKSYCILVFLKNPQKIASFEIDKKGFGLMSAWITVDKIDQVKK